MAKDLKNLERTVAKLEKNKQPLPEEAKTAFAELQAVGENVESQLKALEKMETALKEYDPVEGETDAHDARAFVHRMIFSLQKSRE